MNCVETNNLLYSFVAGKPIINNLNIKVPEGSIYGFLGPNGAGKTTTLRLILGLLKNQKGDIKLFGKHLKENRLEILKNLGSLIESPSLYGHLTAKENLRVLQYIYGCPKSQIAHVLRIVGLENTGSKSVKHFSLGMKQRLGIAMAMLNNPSLLILDEPTNGLDPNGILEIRELLKKINYEKGTSIIISSHLLSEIEKLVTHVGIINRGELLFQGTLERLTEKWQRPSTIIIDVNNVENAKRIIDKTRSNYTSDGNRIKMPFESKEKSGELIRALVMNDIDVYEASVDKSDLESIFFELVK